LMKHLIVVEAADPVFFSSSVTYQQSQAVFLTDQALWISTFSNLAYCDAIPLIQKATATATVIATATSTTVAITGLTARLLGKTFLFLGII
jgi:hypothetical protein